MIVPAMAPTAIPAIAPPARPADWGGAGDTSGSGGGRPAGVVALMGVAETVAALGALGLMVVGWPFSIQTPLPCWQQVIFRSSQQ